MLPEPQLFLIFLAAALALLLTPGPAVLYIIARSVDQGRTAGLVSAVGVGLGTIGHVIAAALGVSALLVASVTAFSILKYLGAIYLIYLGIQKFRERERDPETINAPTQPLKRIFRQGVVVNLLNPKTALFFFAFLPQFIDPSRGSAALQLFVLGLIFVGLGIVSDSLYALLAGTVGHWLKASRRAARYQRYFAGSMYIILGVLTAVSGSNRQ